MNIKFIIRETINEVNNIWFHGTPDNREVINLGSFSNRTNSIDIVSDPIKWNEVQNQMKQARENNNEDLYFKLLDQAGDLRKNITYKKPIYFTNNQTVAKTYADPSRAFDYQNSKPDVLKVTINDQGNILKIPAHGRSFKKIDLNVVKNSLKNAGIDEKIINNYINKFPYYIKNNEMGSETLAIIAQLLGFDIVDVIGVFDSYHGGNIKSTVRIIFDPERIKLI